MGHDRTYPYPRVQLCRDGKKKQVDIHRIVAESFLPNPNNYPVVNHKNEIKTDNRVENLEWTTERKNVMYGSAPFRRFLKCFNSGVYKPVCMISENGVPVAVFPTTRGAAKFTGIPQGSIKDCCKHRLNRTNGYVFVYLDEITNQQQEGA